MHQQETYYSASVVNEEHLHSLLIRQAEATHLRCDRLDRFGQQPIKPVQILKCYSIRAFPYSSVSVLYYAYILVLALLALTRLIIVLLLLTSIRGR
jgi:hypothetical protein